MRPNTDLVSPNFRLMVRDENELEEVTTLGHKSCVYVGHTKNRIGNSKAALSNCDGKGFVSII